MNHRQLQLLALLQSVSRPFTTRNIALRLPGSYPAEKGTCPQIRADIRALNEMGHPIVSTSYGFFYTDDIDDLYRYRESLWQRAEKIILRAHDVTKIIRHKEVKQL